jgi:hypothetical protein
MMYRLQLVMTAGLFIQAAMLLSVGITQVKDNWLFSAVLFLASLLLTALVIGGLRLWEVRGATKKVKGQAAPVRGDPVKDRAPHPVDDSEPPPD